MSDRLSGAIWSYAKERSWALEKAQIWRLVKRAVCCGNSKPIRCDESAAIWFVRSAPRAWEEIFDSCAVLSLANAALLRVTACTLVSAVNWSLVVAPICTRLKSLSARSAANWSGRS